MARVRGTTCIKSSADTAMQTEANKQLEAALKQSRKGSKFGNVRTKGFQSKHEFNRYQQLDLQQKAGLITNLQTQHRFVIAERTRMFNEATYLADFTYNNEHGLFIVEDAKGKETAKFTVQKKLMFEKHNLVVILIKERHVNYVIPFRDNEELQSALSLTKQGNYPRTDLLAKACELYGEDWQKNG